MGTTVIFMLGGISMSKIICEICGTSYPDTSEQCPICGYTRDLSVLLSRDDIEAASAPTPAQVPHTRSKSESAQHRRTAGAAPAHAASHQPEHSATSHTKGGKFSQSNVRKRNESAPPARKRRDEEPEEDRRPAKRESNGFLVVLLLIVIVALLALTGYIGVKYFLPYVNGEVKETEPEHVSSTQPEETTPVEISCTSIVLVSGASVTLEEVGQNWLLNVLVLPIDTTDALTYVSSDETVATVDGAGKITAMGPGEAVITISCGSHSMECHVNCTMAQDTGDDAQPQQDTDPSETVDSTDAQAA